MTNQCEMIIPVDIFGARFSSGAQTFWEGPFVCVESERFLSGV